MIDSDSLLDEQQNDVQNAANNVNNVKNDLDTANNIYDKLSGKGSNAGKDEAGNSEKASENSDTPAEASNNADNLGQSNGTNNDLQSNNGVDQPLGNDNLLNNHDNANNSKNNAENSENSPNDANNPSNPNNNGTGNVGSGGTNNTSSLNSGSGSLASSGGSSSGLGSSSEAATAEANSAGGASGAAAGSEAASSSGAAAGGSVTTTGAGAAAAGAGTIAVSPLLIVAGCILLGILLFCAAAGAAFTFINPVSGIQTTIKQFMNEHDGTSYDKIGISEGGVTDPINAESPFSGAYKDNIAFINEIFDKAWKSCQNRVKRYCLLHGYNYDRSMSGVKNPFTNVNYARLIAVMNLGINDGDVTVPIDENAFKTYFKESDLCDKLYVLAFGDVHTVKATKKSPSYKYVDVKVRKYTLDELYASIGHKASEECKNYAPCTYAEVVDFYMYQMEMMCPDIDFGNTFGNDMNVNEIVTDINTAFDVLEGILNGSQGSSMGVQNQYQGDYRTTYWGTNTISRSGCGITCFAMVASYYSGRTVTPAELCEKYSASYSTGGMFTYGFPAKVAEDYGFHTGAYREAFNLQKTLNELQQGHLVVVKLKAGMYTSNTHYIVLTGCNDTGCFTVADPNRSNETKHGKEYSVSQVAADAVFMYSFF